MRVSITTGTALRLAVAIAAAVVAAMGATTIASAGARVLRVGVYHGNRGQFRTIQAAVDAAHRGDWILIAPGDYKMRGARTPRGDRDAPAGVLVTTSGVHLRGMNRNRVVIDGTRPGSAACSRRRGAQGFGPRGHGGRLGRNGIMVYKADHVSVDNLTICNFLSGHGSAGNELWFNGGGGSGKIGGWGFKSRYVTATSTFFGGESTAAAYGIFSSNWNGGTWDRTYVSNFNDSGYYIGACHQVCNQTLDHGWAQYNALGYSGTNSGGRLLVEHSIFDRNEDGFDTNSQNNDDFPSPQNGACPHGAISPITHTRSCWVFMHNYVYDNNNPNVPSAGAAAAGPVGTGLSISGGRNDTIMDNRFVGNRAWGAIFVAYPDFEKPPANAKPPCRGGLRNGSLLGAGSCLYDDWSDALVGNTFARNGGYGNPTNGDFEQLNLLPGPTDCFRANVNTAGSLTPGAAMLQQTRPRCDGTISQNLNLPFLNEALCDSQVKLGGFGCQPGDSYPRRTRVIMHPLPRHLPTMPNPCRGVPTNPWCKPFFRR